MDRLEATNTELWGLYNVLRSSYLNVLYYGSRATTWSNWNLGFQIVASLGSLSAVGAFLAAGTELATGYEVRWKLAASLVGLISAVCAALPVAMGHAEKISRFERLHFAYSELFQLTQRTIMDVRREGLLTQEQLGTAKLLADLYSRLGQQDDPDFKDELRDKYEKEVREKYTPDSLWYASEHGNQTTPAPASQA